MSHGTPLKILLTGATGFLGSHLLRALIESGHDVVGLKRRTSDISRLPDVTNNLYLVDVEDGLERIFENHPDIAVVIHAATNYGNQGEFPSEVLLANVIMPLKILELMSFNKSGVFINTDTFFCKIEEDYYYLADYILSKKLFYKMGRRFSERNEAAFINVRLEHVFGPGDGPRKFTSSIIKRLLDNDSVIELTAGEQLRDFVFIDDVVSAYMKIINSAKVIESREVREFEVGSGEVHSIRDFVSTAHRITGSRSALSFGALPYREHEIMHSKANLEALHAIGWRAGIDMEAGIEKVVSSMQHA